MNKERNCDQEPAGYPSIDKPWLKYYDESVCSAQIPEGSIWDTIYENNKLYPDEVALLYFGRKITYEKLNHCVEIAERAFIASGVRAGDNVALCMPAMPEAIYSVLALNVIGANAVLLNPTFDAKRMHEVLLDSNVRLLLVASEVFGAVAQALKGTTISAVVECSAMNSLGFVARIMKGNRKDSRSLSWKAFLKRGRGVSAIPTSGLSDLSETPAITVFSSGTTGPSKGIVLSNRSVNAMIFQYKIAGFDMERQDRYFAQVPIWFSTGIVVTMLVPLALGITVILEPLYDFEVFKSHIRKFEPDFLITATGLLEFLSTDQKAAAYGHFKYLAVGGEYLALPAEQRLNAWLERNGSIEGVHKGYGMCECGGAVTSTNSNINAPGSSGIPLPQVVVGAFDMETSKELPYGERGELRVLTPCRMVGYLNNQEATDAYFHIDETGQLWACTGDMGSVSEDGCVYVYGRIKDSYQDADGEVIYLFDIDRAILGIPDVRQCKTVTSELEGRPTHVCHLVLAPDACGDAAMREIAIHCAMALPESHFPRFVRLYEESLPVAPSGKLDTALMKNNLEGIEDLSSLREGTDGSEDMESR